MNNVLYHLVSFVLNLLVFLFLFLFVLSSVLLWRRRIENFILSCCCGCTVFCKFLNLRIIRTPVSLFFVSDATTVDGRLVSGSCGGAVFIISRLEFIFSRLLVRITCVVVLTLCISLDGASVISLLGNFCATNVRLSSRSDVGQILSCLANVYV